MDWGSWWFGFGAGIVTVVVIFCLWMRLLQAMVED